jgi:hypothetical protein
MGCGHPTYGCGFHAQRKQSFLKQGFVGHPKTTKLAFPSYVVLEPTVAYQQ